MRYKYKWVVVDGEMPSINGLAEYGWQVVPGILWDRLGICSVLMFRAFPDDEYEKDDD
jgi:hypothetical protein